MKYDVYEGTRADMENAEGKKIIARASKARMQVLITIKDTAKLVNGETVESYTPGNIIWAEEAM